MKPQSLKDTVLKEAVAITFVGRSGDRELVSFCLRFDAVGWVEIRGGSWGLQWTPDVAPEGYAMGELGDVVVRDLAADQTFAQVIGHRVGSVDHLLVPESTDPIGVVIHWQEAGETAIFNWGDVLVATSAWPQYLIDARATTKSAT